MKILIVTLTLFFAACASAPKLSMQQRRALQVRTFENTSYENVFRAFKSVLQDDGYIIRNQDMQGGLIVAQIQKTDKGSGFWAALGGNKNYRQGEVFEVSANLEKVNEKIIETRVIVQKIEQFSMGGQQGEEILDPEMYKALYNKISVEVERRKATGRK